MRKRLLFLLSFFFVACEDRQEVDLHLKNLEIIAHRGVATQFSENGLRAINKSVDLKLDAVEFDIQMSKDGVIVVFHDDDLFLRTGKSGRVADYTLEELKQLYLINRVGTTTIDKIPTLKEVLALLKGKIRCFIDMKYSSPILEKELVSLLREYEMETTVMILSFDDNALKRLFSLDNSLSLCLLLYDEASFPLDSEAYGHLNALGLHFNLCKKGILENLKESVNVSRIYAYTVNSPHDISEEYLMKIDGVITDNPFEWLSYRNSNP